MDSTFSAAAFIDNYLESVESLPDALQRNLSQLRELDLLYQEKLQEIDCLVSAFSREKDPAAKRKCLIKIQRRLIKSQEYGDEKLQVVGQMMDVADTRSRQIEVDMDNIDTYRSEDLAPSIMKQDLPVIDEHLKPHTEKTAKRNRRSRNNDRPERDSETGSGSVAGSVVGNDTHKPVKKKANKRKSRAKPQGSPTHDIPIDPNEPTYCLCNQVSFGEMIGCDNDECPIEWFHFQCVGLTTKPKGKWYCPKCIQERKRERSYLR